MDAEELTLQTEPTASEKLIVLAHSSKNGRAPSTGAHRLPPVCLRPRPLLLLGFLRLLPPLPLGQHSERARLHAELGFLHLRPGVVHQEPRFSTPGTVRPLGIVTPTNASHVQAAVLCGRRHGIRVRVRSGGHDYEGLSYRSERPEAFAVVDLANLRSVRVNRARATAWVDSGATVGELYHAVAKASGDRLAFPAGLCPTIGVGGHFSGGGFGLLQRKYGIAVDHVIDAVLVDAQGRLLDKKAMGREVFWAIRGGGGESFGIVLSWRVRLVSVPPKVAAFIVPVSVNDGAVDVLTKWQEVARPSPTTCSSG
jgi:FAD/FMN-containing dehydrogenase